MIRMRKHVHRLGLYRLISALYQNLKVPAKGFGIAGDIHHPLGAHMDERLKKALVAARSGGIHEHHVRALTLFYDASTADQIDLSEYDYVVDAIDSVSSKLLLIETCHRLSIPSISCMGAGNKLDPTQFEVSDISKTSVCPLARVMRRELKNRGILHHKVVYSKEAPVNPSGERTPASISFVPSAAGLILAGAVIRDLIAVNS